MALVHVRDQNGIETYVDEAWLERWPTDFERIEDQQPDEPPAAQPDAPAEPEQPAVVDEPTSAQPGQPAAAAIEVPAVAPVAAPVEVNRFTVPLV